MLKLNYKISDLKLDGDIMTKLNKVSTQLGLRNTDVIRLILKKALYQANLDSDKLEIGIII